LSALCGPPEHAWLTLRTKASTLIVNSIWPTALLIGWQIAVLRAHGYRSEDRITVFQTLVHTAGVERADVQTFLKAHNERNLAEYEGRTEIDERLLADLIRCAKNLSTAVAALKDAKED
jgi:hypothetical protein